MIVNKFIKTTQTIVTERGGSTLKLTCT